MLQNIWNRFTRPAAHYGAMPPPPYGGSAGYPPPPGAAYPPGYLPQAPTGYPVHGDDEDDEDDNDTSTKKKKRSRALHSSQQQQQQASSSSARSGGPQYPPQQRSGTCTPQCIQPCYLHIPSPGWQNYDNGMLNFAGGPWPGPGINGGYNGNLGGPPGQPELGPMNPAGPYGYPGLPLNAAAAAAVGGGAPGYGVGGDVYYRRSLIFHGIFALIIMGVAIFIAWTASTPSYASTGCNQTSVNDRERCILSAYPYMESDRVKILVAFAIFYILAGMIMYIWWNSGTASNGPIWGILGAGLILFIMAIKYALQTPGEIHAGVGSIIGGLILLLILMWLGRRMSSGYNTSGWYL